MIIKFFKELNVGDRFRIYLKGYGVETFEKISDTMAKGGVPERTERFDIDCAVKPIIKREIGEVWKEHPVFQHKTKWKVQMPKGVASFSTKKAATMYATEFKKVMGVLV